MWIWVCFIYFLEPALNARFVSLLWEQIRIKDLWDKCSGINDLPPEARKHSTVCLNVFPQWLKVFGPFGSLFYKVTFPIGLDSSLFFNIKSVTVSRK